MHKLDKFRMEYNFQGPFSNRLLILLSSLFLYTSCNQHKVYSYELNQQTIVESIISLKDTSSYEEIGSVVIKRNGNTAEIQMRNFDTGTGYWHIDSNPWIALSDSTPLEQYIIINSILYIIRNDNSTKEKFIIPLDPNPKFKRFEVSGRIFKNQTHIELHYIIESVNNSKLITGICQNYG